MTFPVNLTLTWYYFETLSRDVNSPRRCYVNNEVECGAVLNLTLTCYGKQSAILNFS
jgi:hypothetical protein